MHVWTIDSERGRSIASNPATKVMSSEYGYIVVRKLKPVDDMIVQLQQTHMLVAIYLHWHDLGSGLLGATIIPACCACSRVKAWSRAPRRWESESASHHPPTKPYIIFPLLLPKKVRSKWAVVQQLHDRLNGEMTVSLSIRWLDFHYWKSEIYRVFRVLPSVKAQTLGTESICRVSKAQHSAKHRHTVKTRFAVCKHSAKNYTRQTVHFAECKHSAKLYTRQSSTRVAAVRIVTSAFC
jgi:hypothetical protein